MTTSSSTVHTLNVIELRESALHWLSTANPNLKTDGTHHLNQSWISGAITLNSSAIFTEPPNLPGRPQKPELVSPLNVKRRTMNTLEGRATLIHALCHIEFNAINLALDAVWRFANMPTQYYSDWLKVATEEAYHFTLLHDHLQTLGYHYGDFSGHNSLWEMAERTKEDILARMALVPRTMEARGLDASPPLRKKLNQVGDIAAANILDIILHDEIGHVAIGNHWFNWLCHQQNIAPIETYTKLATQYHAPTLRKPFNLEARRQAGFSEAELNLL